MTYSSSLDDNLTPLVLDTSVLINLRASTYGERILNALPNHILVPQLVAKELEHETSYLNGEHQFMLSLVTSGKVALASLDDREYQLFGRLISGSQSLGDGEAATIAIAACRDVIPVIDERKGRARAQKLIPGKAPGWSLNLLRHPHIVTALGEAESVEALYLALRDGRMRIHEKHCDYIIRLIGVPRAMDCTSLPGYKSKREQWRLLIAR